MAVKYEMATDRITVVRSQSRLRRIRHIVVCSIVSSKTFGNWITVTLNVDALLGLGRPFQRATATSSPFADREGFQ